MGATPKSTGTLAEAGSGDLDITVPTVADGDLKLLHFTKQSSASGMTVPAGWNIIGVTRYSTAQEAGFFAWRIHQSGDPSTVTVADDGANGKGGKITVWEGHDAADPILDGTYTTGSSASTTLTGAGITIDVADSTLVLGMGMSDDSQASGGFPLPTGFTAELYDEEYTSGNDGSIGFAYQTGVGIGATGDKTVTVTPTSTTSLITSGILFAIRPATGGGTVNRRRRFFTAA